MTNIRWKRILLILLALTLPLTWANGMRRSLGGAISMIDFGEIYYGTRSALDHHDPYNPNAVLAEFQADGGRFYTNQYLAKVSLIVVTVGVNLPTALLFAIPFALLPWGVAQVVWIALTACLLILCSYLTWSPRKRVFLTACRLLHLSHPCKPRVPVLNGQRRRHCSQPLCDCGCLLPQE